MTLQECNQIVAIVQEYYRSFYKDYGKEETLKMVNAWYFILEEYDFRQTQVGLKLFLTNDTKGFPPTPGMIIHKVSNATSNHLNEMEAWALVRKAIRNANYEAVEEFNKLPEIVKKCVGGASELKSWASLDSEEVGTVIQSNFMRTYRSVVERQKEIIPESIKTLIEQSKNIGIGEKNENKRI